MLDALREEVCALHAQLPLHGLVAWTSGNLSARVPGEELMVIKASGVPFGELTPEELEAMKASTSRKPLSQGSSRATTVSLASAIS